MIRAAFREFINLRILQRLDLPTMDGTEKPVAPTPPPKAVVNGEPFKPEERIVTTDVEKEVFAYVRQRLAFLVREESLFREIAHIGYRDYQGKFVVFYRRERKGRLFDFYENGPSKYRFAFSERIEIAGDDIGAIDAQLLVAFRKRVAEEIGLGLPDGRERIVA